MTITPVRFFEISVTNLSELLAQQSGKQTDTDTELNYAPWGAKDSGGSISKFLEKDKRAVVSELVATGNITSGRALVVPASGTNLENGTALLNALAAAKAGTYPAPSVPSSTNPTFIFTHGGTFDLGASQLVLDTDHIYIISGTPARRLSKSSGSSFSSAISLAGTNITSTNATSTISITAESGLINVNGRNTNGAPAFYTDGDSKKIFLFGCSGESTNAKTLDKGSSFTTSVLCENSHFETGATGGGGLIMKGSSAYGGTSFSAALNQSVDLDDCIIKFETNISVANGFVCKNSKLSGSFDIGLATGFERTILDSEINCASINVTSGVSDDVNFTNNIIDVSTVPIWTPGIFKNNLVTSTATSGTSTLMLPSQTALDTEVIVQNNNIVSGDETYSISAFAVGAKPSVVDGNVFSKAIDSANVNYNGNNFVEDIFNTSLTTENISVPDVTTDSNSKDKLSDILNSFIGRGLYSGGTLTDNVSFPTTQVDIAGGYVWLSENSESGYPTSLIPFDGQTGVNVTPGFVNYIIASWSPSGVVLSVELNPTSFLYVENASVINLCFPDGDEIHKVNSEPGWQSINKLLTRRFFDESEGQGNNFAKWFKGAKLGTVGIRKITLTEGVFWAALNRQPSPEFNTDTGGDVVCSYHEDGVGGWTKTTGLTQYDNTAYDNGTGTLATLGNGRFTNLWMYIDFNADHVCWQYDDAEYTTLSGAQSATSPTNRPSYLADFSVFLGRVTVQQGSDSVLISSAFGEGDIQTSPVTSHTELANLNADASFQHMTSAEKTAVSSITANGEQAVYNISGSVNLGNGIARQTLSTKNDDIMLRMISSDDGETETDYIQLGSTGVDDLAIQGQYIGADGTTIDLNATGALNLTGSPVRINGVDTAITEQDYIKIGQYYQNLFKYSEDVSKSTYQKIRMTIGGTDGLIPTIDNGTHSVYPSFSVVNRGIKTIRLKAKEGFHHWFAISNATTGNLAYFNVQSMLVRTQTAYTKARITDSDEVGWKLLEFSCDFQVGVNGLYIYVASQDGSDNPVLSFAGDGSTISGYIKEVQMYDGDIDADTAYVKTEDTENTGEVQTIEKDVDKVNRSLVCCVGDSITQGYPTTTPSYSYVDRLKELYPNKTFQNFGVGGATSEDVTRKVLLKAIGKYQWNFDNYNVGAELWPFEEVNSATLSINNGAMRITRNVASDAAARLQVFTDNEEYLVSGIIKGDGTSNPTIVSSVSGVLFTGTNSTDGQEFSFTLSTDSTGETEYIDFVVNGGVSTNYIELESLVIEYPTNIKPQEVLYMIGTNDVAIAADTNVNIIRNIKFCVDQIKKSGAKAYLISVTPSNGYASWSAADKLQLDELRKLQLQYTNCDVVIDSAPLGDASGNLKTYLAISDLLHPNYSGQLVLGDLVAAGIEKQSPGGLGYLARADGQGLQVPSYNDGVVYWSPIAYTDDESIRAKRIFINASTSLPAGTNELLDGSVSMVDGSGNVRSGGLAYNDGTNYGEIVRNNTTGNLSLLSNNYTVQHGWIDYR